MISKLFLLSGADLKLTSCVSVKHPTINDVLGINNGYFCEEIYWSYSSAILSDPYDYMVYLDDRGIDYESVTAFQVFFMRWTDAEKEAMIASGGSSTLMRQALSFYFGQRDFKFIEYQNKLYFLDANDPLWVMDEDIFGLACEFILQLNCLSRTDKIKPANPGYKKILIEDMREQEKRKAREKKSDEPITYIADALNAVLSGGSGSITPSNYSDTHIYQLMSASQAVQRKMVVQSMLNGIYTGMMKADKISNDDLRWA